MAGGRRRSTSTSDTELAVPGSQKPVSPHAATELDTDAFAKTALGSAPPVVRTARATDPVGQDELVDAVQLAMAETDPLAEMPDDDRDDGWRGQSIGRFTVLQQIGAGGMGVVLAAYDPQLDRKVAIKMMHDDVSVGHGARLEREAKAMAQLSHPHVVTVHDTGVHKGRLYIAMEYVEGETLGSWLRSGQRSRKQILDYVLQAGRGLAAAHKAGLVHRDFKPDNVLIGRDGRVRVGDFGLVSGMAEADDPVGPKKAQVLSPSSLTVAGSIMGTPLYMAPEQHAGRSIDARADQFSFCVTLWQALCKEPPYSADTYEQLVANVNRGEVRPVPSGALVSGKLRAVLVRGLAAEPDKRFATMDQLLLELERACRPARWPWLAGGAGAVAVAASAAIWMMGPADDDPCAGSGKRLAGVWDEGRKNQLEAVLRASGSPAHADVWRRVERDLDDYTERWSIMHRDVCEATHVRGQQSDEAFDLRMRCLDRRLAEAASLIDRAAESMPDSDVFKLVDAAGKLRSVDDCVDIDDLRSAFPLPNDSDRRQSILTLQARLIEAESYERLGRYEQVGTIAAEVVDGAAGVEYPPLMAQAIVMRAASEGRAGNLAQAEASLRLASEAAARARDDKLLAKTWIDLMDNLAAQGRTDDALALEVVARAAVERVSDEHDIGARFANSLAALFIAKGKYPEAKEQYEIALRLARKMGEDSPILGHALTNLGTVFWYLSDTASARRYFEEGQAVLEKQLGPRHPTLAYSHINLGSLDSIDGDIDRAITRFEIAIDIWEGAHGPEHINLAHGLEQLSHALARKSDAEGARKAGERALAIREAVLGPDHHQVAQVLVTLADVDIGLAGEDDLLRADERLSRALAIQRATLGDEALALSHNYDRAARVAVLRDDHVKAADAWQRSLDIRSATVGKHNDTAYSHYKLAESQMVLERFDAAAVNFDAAHTLWSDIHGATAPDAIDALARTCEARARQGRHSEALAMCRRAAALAESARLPADVAAKIQFSHARALRVAGKADAARALATQIRDSTDNEAVRSAVNTWLAEL